MIKPQYETLEELVKKRKGYKYLTKDRVSHYQNYKYVFCKGKIFKTKDLDTDPKNGCGTGWNLATLPWILKDDRNLSKNIIIEFSIPKEAIIVIPENSDGKFRTDIIRYEKTHKPETLFPFLRDIWKRLKSYKPINPIQATELPREKKILEIIDQVKNQVGDQVGTQVGTQVWNRVWNQVRAQVWDQVGTQVGTQVWNQVWVQVWAQVWNQVGVQVRNQVWNQVRAQVRDQVGDQVWAQVWAQVMDQVRAQVGDQAGTQVWNQVYITAYFAMKEFLDLDYEHPAFDLPRLGIFVVNIKGKFKVFGKNGKFLGEIEER